MYKYYQAIDDPLVYFRHNVVSNSIHVYISDWDDEWMYDPILLVKDLRRAIDYGHVNEIDNDPVFQ